MPSVWMPQRSYGLVVATNQDQIVELKVSGHRGSLGGDTFLHATVAGQGPDGVIENGTSI